MPREREIFCPNCLEPFVLNSVPHLEEKKTEKIEIRCRQRTRTAFIKYAEAFSTQEDALLSLLTNILDIRIS